MKNFNFVKIYIWGMIFIGTLILRTMPFEDFNNLTYILIFLNIFSLFSYKPIIQNKDSFSISLKLLNMKKY